MNTATEGSASPSTTPEVTGSTVGVGRRLSASVYAFEYSLIVMSLLTMVVSYVLMVLRDNARLDFQCSRLAGQLSCWGEDPFDRVVLTIAGYDVPNRTLPHTQSEGYVSTVETLTGVVSPLVLGALLFGLALLAVRSRERARSMPGDAPPPARWGRRVLWAAVITAGLWGGVYLISVIPSQFPTLLLLVAMLGGGLWAFRGRSTGRGAEISGASPELFGDLRPRGLAAAAAGLVVSIGLMAVIGGPGFSGFVVLAVALAGLVSLSLGRGAIANVWTLVGGALAGVAIGLAVMGFAVDPIPGFIGFSFGLFAVIGLCGATLAGVLGGIGGAAGFAWYFIDRAGADYAWTSGLTGVLLLFVGFLGASMATHDGKHIQIDAIRKNIKSHNFHLYNLVGELVSLGFTVFLGLMAVRYVFHTLTSGEQHPGSGLPVWGAVVPIAFSLLLISVRFAIRIAESFTLWRRRVPAPELAPELH